MKPHWLREAEYYIRLLKELVFVRRCAVCRQPVDAGLLCATCRKHYLLRRVWRCQPREEFLAGQAEPLPEDVLGSVLLLYKYDGAIKEALQQIKFAADASLLPLLREEAKTALPAARLRWLSQYDLAACVPTSPERRQQRGFDVPQELFAPLLDVGGSCLYCGDLLRRVRRTAPLFELQPLERRQELTGCFSLNGGVYVRGKRILLCDDIYTTGSTLAEAARVLLAAGAREVDALALAAAADNWESEE